MNTMNPRYQVKVRYAGELAWTIEFQVMELDEARAWYNARLKQLKTPGCEAQLFDVWSGDIVALMNCADGGSDE